MDFEDVTPEHIQRLQDSISHLVNDYAVAYNQHNTTPAPDSIVERELAQFSESGHAKHAYLIGLFAMESVGDHLMAFRDTLDEPCKTIAPWTCIRAELEAAAIALWLFDPRCEAQERIARGLAYRYDGLVEQRKLGRETEDEETMKRATDRMTRLEKQAIELGIRDEADDKAGIGYVKPQITKMIRETLDRAWEYRMLSAVAHGHLWAIQQVAYMKTELDHETWTESKGMIKTVKPGFMMFAGHVGIESFSRVAWHVWQLFDWERDEITSILEEAYDRIELNDKIRFWRN